MDRPRSGAADWWLHDPFQRPSNPLPTAFPTPFQRYANPATDASQRYVFQPPITPSVGRPLWLGLQRSMEGQHSPQPKEPTPWPINLLTDFRPASSRPSCMNELALKEIRTSGWGSLRVAVLKTQEQDSEGNAIWEVSQHRPALVRKRMRPMRPQAFASLPTRRSIPMVSQKFRRGDQDTAPRRASDPG
jgi:hypothetical protein